MAQIFTLPKAVPILSSGAPVGSAKLYFYQAGTLVTQSVYTTSALNVAHAQPVQADTAGVFPTIYLNPSASYDYRIQLKTFLDVLIYDQDNVPKGSEVTQAYFNSLLALSDSYKRTAAEITASVVPTNYAIPSHDAVGVVYPERYGANTTPGTTDMTSAIQAAINVAKVSGELLLISPGTWAISSTLTINSKINMEMAPGALIKALSTFPNPASVDDGSWLIDANHANVADSVFTNIRMHGLAIAMGLRVGLGSRARVIGGYASNMRGPGLWISENNDVLVDGFTAESCGIDPALNATALTTSIRAQGTDSAHRSENIVFKNCTVRTSGGKSMAMAYCNNSTMENNFAKGWTDSYSNGYYAASCTGIYIRGNIGIQSAGSLGTNVVKLSNDTDECVIEDNYFEMNTDADIIHVQNCMDTTIRGNRFRKTVATSTGRCHIRTNDDGVDTPSQYLLIQGNNFVGHGNTNTICISTPSTVGNVTVIGNRLKAFAAGVQVVGDTCIVRGNAYDDVVLPEQLGGGTNPRADYSYGVIRTTSDSTATGAGFSTLSLTLPAGIMDRTRSIRVKGSGTKTGAVGTKTLSFRFGSTDFLFHAAANDTNSWYFEAEVTNVSETSQRIHGVGFNGATALPFVGTAAENTANALSVGLRVNPAGAGDTVVLKMLTIEIIP